MSVNRRRSKAAAAAAKRCHLPTNYGLRLLIRERTGRNHPFPRIRYIAPLINYFHGQTCHIICTAGTIDVPVNLTEVNLTSTHVFERVWR